jgi:hypothetical protein
VFTASDKHNHEDTKACTKEWIWRLVVIYGSLDFF